MVRNYPALDRTEQPLCSICIANYNGVQLLADCLDSLYLQSGNVSFEVIVHDDASTDDSVQFIRDKYPQIELIASDQNVGFCVANNRMAALARGRFLLLLNNDAALHPDALAALEAASRDYPHAGILTLPQFDWESGQLVDMGCRLDPFYNPVPSVSDGDGEVAMAIGACLWIERGLWLELGGFPTWMGSIAEDMFLCCASRLAGRPVIAIAKSGYRHRQGASFGGGKARDGKLDTTVRRRQLSERNKTLVMLVMTPAWALPFLLALHLTLLAVEGMAIATIHADFRIFADIYIPAIASPVSFRKQWLSARAQRPGYGLGNRYFSAFVVLPRKLAMLYRYGFPRIRR